jgi:UDPglucose 6-dehydrogenase
MDLAVVGAGYVGLVTAACLANLGNRVRCIDLNRERIEMLRRGAVPFNEPDLDRLVRTGIDSGRLHFDSQPAAVRGAELAIVSVGTLDETGQWTAANVRRAVLGLTGDPDAPRAIVIRSTLLPGTAAQLSAEAWHLDPRVRLAINPEFTREGSAVNDFLLPQRVVVGVGVGRSAASADDGDEPTAALVAALRRLYEPLQAPMLVTDLTSAEMIKVASNVFLAAKITFANELARLSVATGADAMAVVEGLGLDHRIGRAVLSPGPGYGGSCLPSQARALPDLARRAGVRTPLMEAIAPSNDEQTDWLLEQAEGALGRSLAGTRVALLGLTFKADTDDLRESPALRLAAALVGRGAQVVAFDPIATDAGVAQLARAEGVAVAAAPDAAAACAGADLAMIATEWPAFRTLDWEAIAPTMRRRIVGDAGAVVEPVTAALAGLTVVGLAASPAVRAAKVRVAPARQPAAVAWVGGLRVVPSRVETLASSLP